MRSGYIAKCLELDLTPDLNVSRRHARLWESDGHFWIQDLGSRGGTFVNGLRIADPVEITTEDAISLGDTILQLAPAVPENPSAPNSGDIEAGNYIYSTGTDSIAIPLDPPTPFPDSFATRLSVLADLLTLIPRRQTLDAFVGAFLSKTMAAVPDAERSALLLLDPETKQLVLKAYVSSTEPAVSETLSRKALIEQQSFVWRRIIDRAPSSTSLLMTTKAALYTPIVWRERTLGVLCLDNSLRDLAFTGEDLRLVTAAAQLAASAIAAHDFQDRLQFKSAFHQRLLYQFSAETLGNLAAKAQREALVPNAARSEITLLALNLTSPQNTPSHILPYGAVDWWHDHFDLAIDIIHSFHGTVYRVSGSLLTAVFSSPETDPHQYEHALRAALSLRVDLGALQRRLTAQGETPGEFRIALHSGPALNGLFGSTRRLIFQVSGEPITTVNALAAAVGPKEIRFLDVSSGISSMECGVSPRRSKAWRAGSLWFDNPELCVS